MEAIVYLCEPWCICEAFHFIHNFSQQPWEGSVVKESTSLFDELYSDFSIEDTVREKAKG